MVQSSEQLIEKTAVQEPESNRALPIESRFGRIVVNLDNAIYFPMGLLGLADDLHFCLVDSPNESLSKFKILQSVNDTSMAFILLPLTLENGLIDYNDIKEACTNLGIEENDVAVMVIATSRKIEDKVSVTVNTRAPIFVDTTSKLGAQYVFQHNKYQIRQQLN